MNDVTVLADAIAPVLRELVDATIAPVLARLATAEKQLADALAALAARPDIDALVAAGVAKAMADQPKVPTAAEVAALVPAPQDGKDADPATVAAIVMAEVEKAMADRPIVTAEEVAFLVPKPADGKSVTIEDVRPLVDEIVAAKVDAIPLPRDGKDVEPEAVLAMVAAAVEAHPKAKDGKSVTIEDVRPLVDELVAAKVDAIPLPRDGKDVEPEAVLAMVAAAVEALPKAKDGKSVTIEDVRPLVDELVAAKVDAIPLPRDGKDVEPEAVLAMVAAAVEALPKAKDGKSVTIEDVRPLVDELVAAKVDAIPLPRDGKDVEPEAVLAMVAAAVEALPKAKDGKSVTVEQLRPLVEKLAAEGLEDIRLTVEASLDATLKALPAIPTAEEVAALVPKGADGKDANPEAIEAAAEKVLATWDRPKDGTSVTIDELRPVVDEAVDKTMAGRPLPKDGKDGIGLAGALKDHEGCLVLTLSDGTIAKLGRVDGEPGKDGLDGLGFDDIAVDYDGERRFAFKLVRGERVKEFAFRLPIPINREVFKDGRQYEAQDEVTFGGSTWQARRDTSARPGMSDDWFLKNKKGRDGKDGVMTEPKAKTPVKLT